MPPKRKRNAAESENGGSKPKKQKIIDKYSTVVDSNLQNINQDITKNILDDLKLSTHDLKALSETCSSWNSKIATHLREMWAHTLPFTHKKFNEEEMLDTMTAIGKARQFISDIQIFEFNESLSDNLIEKIKSIPWCPYSIVVVTREGASTLDLRKPDPIVPHPNATRKEDDVWGDAMYINDHRKQLVVIKKVLDQGKQKKKGSDGSHKNILCIYNISDDGKVDVEKQIDTKEEDLPIATFLRDDGSIWVAWPENKVRIFQGSKIETNTSYEYPASSHGAFDTNVVGFIEHRGSVKLFLQQFTSDDSSDEDDGSDVKDRPLNLLYDVKTKTHEELPIKSKNFGNYEVTYINDSLQLLDDGAFAGSCSLEPVIQRQVESNPDLFDNNSLVTLSPDGTRLLEYQVDERNEANVQISLKIKSDQTDYHSFAESNILFYYKEPKDEEVEPVSDQTKKGKSNKSQNVKKKKEQPKSAVGIHPQELKFFWLSNDIIVASHKNRISILDIRNGVPKEGFKAFELPFLGHFALSHMARLDDTSFVIMHKTSNLIGFKISV